MIGKLSSEEIENLLNRQIIGRIGCCVNNRCYVVPISFAYDGTYIYCRSEEGMKIRMMRENPQVCFETDNTRNHANWQSVIAWGTYEELSDGPERNEALSKLHSRTLPLQSSETTHLGNAWPFTSDDDTTIPGIVFRIRLTEKSGRFERSSEGYYFAT